MLAEMNMSMKPENCIFFQLAKASQAGTRFWAKQVSQFGVTAVQAMVLSFLSDQDEITAGALGNKVQLDSATLTGILDRLASAGLIERRDNPNDRRAILVCLTDEGKKVGNEICGLIKNANRVFLSKLTNEEEIIFRTLLRKMITSGK